MAGVFKKELGQYFRTPVGYIFISIFLAISGAYFFMVNLVSQNGDIKAFFSAIFTLLMFLVPMLTMGLFAEEKKQTTDQLLLTAPVSITGVILGKFFATIVFFSIPLGVTLIYPCILAALGSVQLMATAGNYLGVLLLCSTYVAIGLLISVLTENQLVAAATSYAVLLILYLSSSLADISDSPLVRALLGFVSVQKHFEAFTYGVLNPADVVYFISMTALFLFFSIYTLESKRIS